MLFRERAENNTHMCAYMWINIWSAAAVRFPTDRTTMTYNLPLTQHSLAPVLLSLSSKFIAVSFKIITSKRA